MGWIRLDSLIVLACTTCASLLVCAESLSVAKEISSKDHPTLKKMLDEHPDSDKDKDGVLSYGEYAEYLKSHPRKRPDGKPMGPISMLLPNGDLLVTDFEENNLGRMRQQGWTIEGDAFAQNPDQGTRLMRRRTARHHGKYLLTSYARSDSATGRVVSPKFTLEKRYLRFLLSGGKHPRRACVNLLVDGKTVRTATGENDDWFVAVAFDIAAFRGRDAIIEITDDQREVWGHINVDWIVQTDTLDAEAKQRVIATEPAPAPPKGRTVLTTRGPIRGTVSVAAGKIRVGEQTLEVGDLLQVTRDNKNRPPSATGGLKLSDGQVWFGRVLVEKDGKLGFEHPALGRLDVPLDQIACIEFQPGAPDKCEPGVLYRTKGEPIPGKVVWIRENDIAIDCALGVVPIPRGSLCRFVLAKVSGPPGPCDEVALLDGNLLRGELQIAGDRFALKERTTQKVVPLEWSAIHYIRRSPAGVSWLDTLDGKVLERVGPLLPPPAPEVVSSSALLCLRAIRMMPRTVVRYELPAPGKLRGELAPVPGCRGTVTVRIHQAGSPVWEKEVGPDTKPIALDVALKPGEVRIEVAFRGRIAFPCGIDWRDSHIVSGK